MSPSELLQKYPVVSDQVSKSELTVILGELQKVLTAGLAGDVVEFGCYAGATSLFIQRLLAQNHDNKSFHVYDSFMGLPEKTIKDYSGAGEQFVAGKLAVTKSDFIRNFKKANLPMPIIHKGWFSEVRPREVPNIICFAFLDGDYYESISDSLRLIVHNLSAGAVIVVDDYANEALPGASKAVDEWLAGKNYQCRIEASLAIIYT